MGTDVGFIGSFERDRAGDMKFLAQHNCPVRIWGNGWGSYRLQEDNLVIERRALANTADNGLYSKAIGVTEINLAILSKANRDLNTDRTIGIPTCGGLLMADF